MFQPRRIHWFEFEDLPGLPRAIRDAITDLLEHQLRAYRIYDPVCDRLWALTGGLDGTIPLVDLCSGGGGPIARVQHLLARRGGGLDKVVLTDKFPNAEAFARRHAADPRIGFVRTSVDATDVPATLRGVRTLFTAFHHFDRQTALGILRDAAAKRAPLAVFEFTGRRWSNVLGAALTGVPLVCWDTLWLRPFNLSRALLTYVLPVIPLCYTWDAVVSHLRSYTADELRAMAAEVGGEGYRWEAGELPGKFFPVTYLIGEPDSRPA